mmetsp:Transcript_16722/g.25268  ORF Transcript_16722/g.25268 Transcript_16722/m.25268 type:complete len:90 (+) Transcript_16722:160-429(+)
MFQTPLPTTAPTTHPDSPRNVVGFQQEDESVLLTSSVPSHITSIEDLKMHLQNNVVIISIPQKQHPETMIMEEKDDMEDALEDSKAFRV